MINPSHLCISLLFLASLEAMAAVPNLNCNWAFDYTPRATHFLRAAGSVGVEIGYSAEAGAIGTWLGLTADGETIPVLEARSGTGSAWQFTSFQFRSGGLQDIVNQGGGNSTGVQWGAPVTFATANNSVLNSNFFSRYPDSFTTNGAFRSNTPCGANGNTTSWDQIAQNTSLTQLSPGNSQSMSRLTVEYIVKPKFEQTWELWQPVHAMYLRKDYARYKNAKMYLIPSQAKAADLAPLAIDLTGNKLSIPMQYLDTNLTRGVPDGDTTFVFYAGWYDYVGFTWKTQSGKEIGFIVPFKFGGEVTMENKAFCLPNSFCDENLPQNGTIHFSSRLRHSNDVSNFTMTTQPFGYNYQQTYTFGDIQQLAKAIRN